MDDSRPRRPGGWLDVAVRWLPVVVWAGCISWFSTEAFSAPSTHRYIDPVLRFLFGDLTPAEFRFLHSVIRKAAHLTEYAMLAILLCRALAQPGMPVGAAVLLRTLVVCAAYAGLDELHQTLERTRTGSPIDSAVDVAGATAGALMFAWWRNLRVRSRTAAAPPPRLSARYRGTASGT